jgi:hypothetical protein
MESGLQPVRCAAWSEDRGGISGMVRPADVQRVKLKAGHLRMYGVQALACGTPVRMRIKESSCECWAVEDLTA